jgi:hypothetical protein
MGVYSRPLMMAVVRGLRKLRGTFERYFAKAEKNSLPVAKRCGDEEERIGQVWLE